MGLDLRLLPVEHDDQEHEWGFSHSILEVGGVDDHIHDACKRLPRVPLPMDFSTFVARGKDGNPTYGNTQRTPYGDKLEAVRAADLANTLAPFAAALPTWFRLRGAVAYLRALPADTKIALYWH